MVEVDGGGIGQEIFKAVIVDMVVGGLKALGKAMADDWNSRDGSPRSMTSSYISNPYH